MSACSFLLFIYSVKQYEKDKTRVSVLDSAPFDDIFTEDYQGHMQYYSFDAFRRLYNDAVESMNCYRNVISSLEKELDLYFSRCSELEDIIRDLTEE